LSAGQIRELIGLWRKGKNVLLIYIYPVFSQDKFREMKLMDNIVVWQENKLQINHERFY